MFLIDFVWIDKENYKNLVHVSLSMKDPKTRSREVTSLLCAMEELGLGNGKIITLDEEKTLKEDDKTVEIIPD